MRATNVLNKKEALSMNDIHAVVEDPVYLTPEEEVTEEPKKKFNKLDVYVIFSIACLLIYTIVSQLMVTYFQAQLDTLTTCFFACFGGEILSACLIKIFKLRKEHNDESDGGVG